MHTYKTHIHTKYIHTHIHKYTHHHTEHIPSTLPHCTHTVNIYIPNTHHIIVPHTHLHINIHITYTCANIHTYTHACILMYVNTCMHTSPSHAQHVHRVLPVIFYSDYLLIPVGCFRRISSRKWSIIASGATLSSSGGTLSSSDVRRHS